VAVYAIGLTMLVPFLWMISTSLKPDAQVFIYPPTWIPAPPKPENYAKAWEAANFSRFFVNSAVVSVTATLVSLLFNCMAGYGFARYQFRGRDGIFLVVLSTIMIPVHTTMIPTFIMLKYLGWLDSFAGLIVPGLSTAFGIFLMRQFMSTIPSDLIDAGRMDGAGEFFIFWRIVLPLCRPAVAALSIFTFMGSWNAFIWPLIVVQSENMKTLPLAVAGLAAGLYVLSWPLLMAGATMVIVPVIVVYVALQRQFIEGVTLTGLKGA
jgi:multiple sugar transport system permease protein